MGILSSGMDSLLMQGLPALITLLWAIFALLLIGSFAKTFTPIGLYNRGAKAYNVMSFIFAITQIIIAVVYCIRDFSGGMFGDTDGEESFTAELIRSDHAAAVMFVLYYVAVAATVIFTVYFSKTYYNAVESAQRSIQMNGTNMYMNGIGYASVYYNQPYTAPVNVPQPVNSAPPVPVQKGLDTPPSSFKAVPPTYSSSEIQLPTEIKCPSCGAENNSSCKFCANCGNTLSRT